MGQSKFLTAGTILALLAAMFVGCAKPSRTLTLKRMVSETLIAEIDFSC